MRFFWVKLHIDFAFHRRDPYGSGVTCPWIFYYRTYACNIFPGFFYTISYRNLKLSMRFFWVKLHIEFAFHRRKPYGSRVTCPWIFYYRTYACNSFPGFFYTVSYRNLKLSMSFFWFQLHIRVVVTLMVPELRALGLFTIGNMHVTVFHHQKRGH
jgi:hypothetical protein